MALIRWRPGWYGWEKDPFREIGLFQDQMNRFWDSFFTGGAGSRSAGVFPPLAISEDEQNVYVRAEVPGMGPEDLEVTTEDNNLILQGERRFPDEGEGVNWHRREREAGRFHRITSLPVRVSPEKVSALCQDGILTVTLPKAPEARPSRIQVRSA